MSAEVYEQGPVIQRSLEISRGKVITSPSRFTTPRPKGFELTPIGPGFEIAQNPGGAVVDVPLMSEVLQAEAAAEVVFRVERDMLKAATEEGTWVEYHREIYGQEFVDRERKRVRGFVGEIYAAASIEGGNAVRNPVKTMTSGNKPRRYLMTQGR